MIWNYIKNSFFIHFPFHVSFFFFLPSSSHCFQFLIFLYSIHMYGVMIFMLYFINSYTYMFYDLPKKNEKDAVLHFAIECIYLIFGYILGLSPYIFFIIENSFFTWDKKENKLFLHFSFIKHNTYYVLASHKKVTRVKQSLSHRLWVNGNKHVSREKAPLLEVKMGLSDFVYHLNPAKDVNVTNFNWTKGYENGIRWNLNRDSLHHRISARMEKG